MKIRLAGKLLPGFTLALMFAGGITFAAQQEQSPAAVEACRMGNASMCQRLGFPAKTAKDIAKILKKKEKGAAEIRKNAYPDEVLSGVALYTTFPEVGRAAVGGLKTPAAIVNLIMRVAAGDISAAALNRIEDPQDLARIAIGHKDLQVRLPALARIKDPEVIISVFANSKLSDTWPVALARVTDPVKLNELATKPASVEKGLAVLQKIDDPNQLAQIALANKMPEMRRSAVAKITDNKILAMLVDKSTDAGIAMAALARISDQELLGAIVANSSAADIRKAAMAKIVDDAVLIRLIRTGNEAEIRMAAFGRLRNRSALVGMADALVDEAILFEVISLAEDQAVLTKVARAGISSRVQWAALARLAQLFPSLRLADVPPKTFTNSIGMNFVWVDPGHYPMGSDDESRGEKTARTVILSEGYYLQTTEVTQAQWEAVMGANPSRVKKPDHPVEYVSWDDVREFLKRLNLKEKDTRYRLPTEAEWECACRAGGMEVKAPKNLPAVAWFADNAAGGTHPVGQKSPNAWGLFDMLGNVQEWVANYVDSRALATTGRIDPQGPDKGYQRSLRGGAYDRSGPILCSMRSGEGPNIGSSLNGFRCARTW